MATNKNVMEILVRLSALLLARAGVGNAAGRAEGLHSPDAVRGRCLLHPSRFPEGTGGANLTLRWLKLLSSTFLSREAARPVLQTVSGRAAHSSPVLSVFSPHPASWQSRGAPGVLRLAMLLSPSASELCEFLLPRPLDCPFIPL